MYLTCYNPVRYSTELGKVLDSIKKPIKNVIFGIAGLELTEEERDFYLSVNPLGFILFKRNCESKEQIIALTTSLKSLVDHEPLILIDQEGGRVARLLPPLAHKAAPSKVFGDIAATDMQRAKAAVYVNSLLTGRELAELGINVNCAPVADILCDGASDIIGDRSFGKDIATIVELCKMVDMGLHDAGVRSIIKHIPGHGRADKDSHHELPFVGSPLEELEKTDFKVFSELSYIQFAMTAHVVYEALDPMFPATISRTVVGYIRNNIGFSGILITDDLSMRALSGSIRGNAESALSAGCDVLLHCNGKMQEMREVAASAVELSSDILRKIHRAGLREKHDFAFYEELHAMDSKNLSKQLFKLIAA